MERPDIPRWPEQLRAGMAEIERTFRRHRLVYRPRTTQCPGHDKDAVYWPKDALLRLLDASGYDWTFCFSAEELAALAERNAILITGGFND